MTTQIRGRQVRDETIKKEDLAASSVTRDKVAITPSGDAMIRKILLNANNSLEMSSSGADSGTGDVTLGVSENYVKTTALIERYRIKAGMSGDYVVSDAETLEKIPFDTSLIEYDNAEHRYSTTNKNLLIKHNEVWDINIQILVDAAGPFSLVLFDETNTNVLATAYCYNNARGTMAYINTLVAATGDTLIAAYIYASFLTTTIITTCPHGFTPANLCSFKRIR